MYLVTKTLKYNRNKIINNLTAVIQSIIAMDTTGTDVLKLQEQIKKVEGKRANLIDLYMSNLINKDEFTATRASCDAEIEELQSIIESVDKQREMIEQQQQLLKEIEDAIKEIVSGVEYEDEFYKHILDKMVVQDKDNIDVYLNLLPMKWSYTVAKASKKAVASEWNISEASLPTSVSLAAPYRFARRTFGRRHYSAPGRDIIGAQRRSVFRRAAGVFAPGDGSFAPADGGLKNNNFARLRVAVISVLGDDSLRDESVSLRILRSSDPPMHLHPAVGSAISFAPFGSPARQAGYSYRSAAR